MSVFTVGLDLGQSRDYSALAVVERVAMLPPADASMWHRANLRPVVESRVRHIQRWELGTPFRTVVDDVAALLHSGPLVDAWLYLDATGVGRGITEMFTEAFREGRMGSAWPVPVTITGGGSGTGGSMRRVAKVDLVSAVQAPLEKGLLKVAAGLPLADKLERELKQFRVKISAKGSDTFGALRESDHDDLVVALALALRGWHPGAPREERAESLDLWRGPGGA